MRDYFVAHGHCNFDWMGERGGEFTCCANAQTKSLADDGSNYLLMEQGAN